MSIPSEKQVRAAIKALDAAWRAMEPISVDEPRDSASRLRSDIREYVDYLDGAKWWRSAKTGGAA